MRGVRRGGIRSAAVRKALLRDPPADDLLRDLSDDGIGEDATLAAHLYEQLDGFLGSYKFI